MKNNFIKLLALFLVLILTTLSIISCDIPMPPGFDDVENGGNNELDNGGEGDDVEGETGEAGGNKEDVGNEKDDTGAYEDAPTVLYEERNGNIPYFTEDEIVTESYEYYSELDALGRCGVVMACIGTDLMPKEGEERESISSVKPSGWIQADYSASVVPGKYLYHRAHLIGWQLTAENANNKNLITGTQSMNTKGMLAFENMVADYLREETENHVMYRVTPDFKDQNLVASGVLIEAYSVEDDGEGISFCVYIFNSQPGIEIDYKTGASRLSNITNTPDNDSTGSTPEGETPEGETYILNTSSKRFHHPDCSGVKTMKEENKQEYTGSREELIDEGYIPCGTCKP